MTEARSLKPAKSANGSPEEGKVHEPESRSVKEHLVRLIDFAKSADLEEVVWEKGDRRVAFRRRLESAPAIPAAAPAQTRNGSAPAKPKSETIVSPMVGTFYRAASQDRPPIVVDGDEISSGQRVAVVEAMKIMKDVISHVSGRITKIHVENGKPVEYGQKLFEIEVKE